MITTSNIYSSNFKHFLPYKPVKKILVRICVNYFLFMSSYVGVIHMYRNENVQQKYRPKKYIKNSIKLTKSKGIKKQNGKKTAVIFEFPILKAL